MTWPLLRFRLLISVFEMAMVTAANPNKDALSRKLQDQVTCGICLDRYTDPRTLPCVHSYCKNCIDRIPVELENGRHVIRCPACRRPTQLGEKGASIFPVAFHINNWLEIYEMLNLKPAEKEIRMMCLAHGNKPMDIYCETCEEHICFKCSTQSHRNHECDRAEDLFTKHKEEIKTCLQPLKKHISAVEQILALFDNREREMRDEEKSVQKKIDGMYRQLLYQLERSRRRLSHKASTDLQQKLQLHSVQRANVEAVLVQLKSCCEFVEEELRSQLQYQIQAAKKQLVRHIKDIHSKAKVSELQPVQDTTFSFVPNSKAVSACSNIGDVCSTLSFSISSLFSTDIPSSILEDKLVEVLLTAPFTFSVSRISCQLTHVQSSTAKPVVCPITGLGKGKFKVMIHPYTAGHYQLKVSVDGMDVYGSPFSIKVSKWKRKGLVRFFDQNLVNPCGIAVTDDRKHIIVSELNGHCITVLSCTGELVKKFGRLGNGPIKFMRPWNVAVSADDNIFVADQEGMLQKINLSSSSFVASVDLKCGGVAVHPSGKVLVTDPNTCNIIVFNADLTPSHTFGGKEVFESPWDLAIDGKGMVYVTDRFRGLVLKFTLEGKHLGIIGSKGVEPHKLTRPLGISVDSNDIIYVTDMVKHHVVMYTTDGEFLETISHSDNKIIYPRGIAVDKKGQLYVCDDTGEVLVSRL